MGLFSRAKLRSVDFYRKIPRDMSEGTVPGSVISIGSALLIALLLVSEIGRYATPTWKTKVVVDRSLDGDMMKINFNVSFPALSCEFASVDVGDAMGLNRYNLTKTVFKRALARDGTPLGAIEWDRDRGPNAHGRHADDDEHAGAGDLVRSHKELVARTPEDPSHPEPVHDLDPRSFEKHKKASTVLLVNYHAPWCPWCRRLEPTWEAAGIKVHSKYPKGSRNRVVLAKVDCTRHLNLCTREQVTGYPTIRVYTEGSDDVAIGNQHDHASYHGDRTLEAITEFAFHLLPDWKIEEADKTESRAVVTREEALRHESVRAVKGPGCSVTGFVLAKKVPGHVWITANSNSHSFHPEEMNMTHTVNHLFFGNQLGRNKLKALERYKAADAGGTQAPDPFATTTRDGGRERGASSNWHDKLAGVTFRSLQTNVTHEHYLQTVLTTLRPAGSYVAYHAYEYTQHSHALVTTRELPRAKFHFNPSPVQVVVTEEREPFYHFITTLMAIVGGVYSVCGIADGFVHNTLNMMRKFELGKQG